MDSVPFRKGVLRRLVLPVSLAVIAAGCGLPAAEPLGGDVTVQREIDYRRLGTRIRQRIERPHNGTIGDQHRLDVYRPAAPGPHPIVVYLHGGWWVMGDKSEVFHKARFLPEAGYVLVSVDYPFPPLFRYPEQAAAVAEALAWVRRNAERIGGDPERILVLGHSAGAHLAALSVLDPRYFAGVGLSPGALRALVLLDGVGYDLATEPSWDWPEYTQTFVNLFSEDPATLRDASPQQHALQAKGEGQPAFLVVYLEHKEHSRLRAQSFAKVLAQRGFDVTELALHRGDHATLDTEFGAPGDIATKRILGALGRMGLRGTRMPQASAPKPGALPPEAPGPR